MQKTEELEIYRRMCKGFKTVFDVGSRDDIDYYFIHPNCTYHLFEPNVDALVSLKSNIADIKEQHFIIVNEFGLSDENKDGCVYYKNVESFKPHWSVDSVDSGERYSLKKLDEYCWANGIDEIDFLKIDVEALDYSVILGGIRMIKEQNRVRYIQVEYSGSVRQYVELLTNFDWYWMIEPVLLNAIVKISNDNDNFEEYNRSLVPLDDDLIDFIDNYVSPSGNGGNIFGVRKNYVDNLIFKVTIPTYTKIKINNNLSAPPYINSTSFWECPRV